MKEKNYTNFLNKLKCQNIILLAGNHCNRRNMYGSFIELDQLISVNDYIEIEIDNQLIVCSHYPMFNWNYQEKGSINLHGHLHGNTTNLIMQLIKLHKSLDVGIDNYFNIYGSYSLFSIEQINEILKDKTITNRHI